MTHEFSEPLGTTSYPPQTASFTAENATISNIAPVPGNDQSWRTTLQLTAAENVSITLPATAPSSANAAICTEDDKTLAQTTTANVPMDEDAPTTATNPNRAPHAPANAGTSPRTPNFHDTTQLVRLLSQAKPPLNIVVTPDPSAARGEFKTPPPRSQR